MKKLLSTIALCLTLTMTINIIPVWAENGITVNYEGSMISFDTSPFLENGTTMVPMRAIAEKIGAEVLWSHSSKVATVKRGDDILEIPAGGTIAKRNEKEIPLDMPAKVVNGRVFVPLRFVGEQLGLNVVWDKDTQTIALTEKAQAPKKVPITQYTSKDNSYRITLPGENWSEEDSELHNTIIVDSTEGELTVLVSNYRKEDLLSSGIQTAEEFAKFNQDSVYYAVYSMGSVTPKNISLTNMNVVSADEIKVSENGVISKALFVYAETEQHYYVCAITGHEALYDQHITELQKALQTIK